MIMGVAMNDVPWHIHVGMMSLNVKEGTFTLNNGDVWHYVYISSTEWQLWKEGDMPSNYTKGEMI